MHKVMDPTPSTSPSATPIPNNTSQPVANSQPQFTFEQLQTLLVSLKPSDKQDSSTSKNPFFAAADKVAKLNNWQCAQIPGILTTYSTKAGNLSIIFMDLVKYAYLAQKYPARSDFIKTYIIEFLRELGSWDRAELEQARLAIRVEILGARAQQDASALAFRKGRTGQKNERRGNTQQNQAPYQNQQTQNRQQQLTERQQPRPVLN